GRRPAPGGIDRCWFRPACSCWLRSRHGVAIDPQRPARIGSGARRPRARRPGRAPRCWDWPPGALRGRRRRRPQHAPRGVVPHRWKYL
ncbi:MAG: hypothetical protein AVDCRST_MAG59-2840, partial [uncultured Thermomicrobiales bacterium]